MTASESRGGLLAAVAALVGLFLLATNPVVANAAQLITGHQIKNGSVTTKDIKDDNLKGRDIKNHSLTSHDLAAGTIRKPQVSEIQQFTGLTNITADDAYHFVVTPATVTLSSNQAVLGTASMAIGSTSGTGPGGHAHVDFCYAPTGLTSLTNFHGGSYSVVQPVDNAQIDAVVDVFASPGAGTWDIGPCLLVHSGSTYNNNDYTEGWLEVLNRSGPAPLNRPAGRVAR